MRRKCIAFVAALALAPVGAAQAPAAVPQAVATKTCRPGYTHASLPWGHKCLRRGQFCKISGDRSYHRYGYHCHTGRLR